MKKKPSYIFVEVISDYFQGKIARVMLAGRVWDSLREIKDYREDMKLDYKIVKL